MVRTLPVSLRAWCICAVFSTLLISSCKKAIDAELPDEAYITELKSFLASSSGYTVEKVNYSPASKTFIVDKDVEVTMQDAEAHLLASKSSASNPAGRTAQRKLYYMVSPSIAPAIKVYINSSVPASWRSSIDSAIANWNAAGSLINISKVKSSSKANVTIGANFSETATIASSNYPQSNGYPGKNIYINTYYNNLQETYKIFAITHEFGHAFGLTHTDGTYGYLIAGTPLTDPGSVMNTYVSNWIGFSTYDFLAIRIVYPK